MAGFSAGIQQGVATSLWVKHATRHGAPIVRYRDDVDAARARDRRQQMLDSLAAKRFDSNYKNVKPDRTNRFSFRPSNVSAAYQSWSQLVDLCAIAPINGLMEKRAGALIDIDRSDLERRMRTYLDPEVEWTALHDIVPGLTSKAAGFDTPRAIRNKVLNSESFGAERVLRYVVRPFDLQWCYYSGISPLWNRSRPGLWALCRPGNAFLLSRRIAARTPEGPPFLFARGLSDDHALAPDAACFALRLPPDDQVADTPLFTQADPGGRWRPNLSTRARGYLDSLDIRDLESDPNSAALVWLHALAIGYSPAYLRENADGVRRDWPRIPLPKSRQTLHASAELGERVVALLDTDTPVKQVDAGTLRGELKSIGSLTRVGGGAVDPDAGHLDVNVGWGHQGKKGVTMPGKGQLTVREYTNEERNAIEAGAKALGLSIEQALDVQGSKTCDVYLNGTTYWSNVPSNVWEFVIGGYPVIKKWLSYREHDMLGRALTAEEARYVTSMIRRLAALTLSRPALNANYRRCAEEAYAWPPDE